MANSPEENISRIKFPHAETADEIINKLGSDPDQGLSTAETKQRLKKYGPNQLEEYRQKSLVQIFIDQLTNFVVYLLTATAFLFGDISEGAAILIVLVLNAMIGFWMEYQACNSIDALHKMDKITSRVIRSGRTEKIDAERLVPGDIILLKGGDLIPADGNWALRLGFGRGNIYSRQ